MMNRREALVRMGGIMAGGMLGGKALAATDQAATAAVANAPAPGQPLTIAHITDVHITDKYDAEKWVSKALNMINDHPSKPSFIFNTGDCVMDSSHTDRKQADHYWKVWHTTLERENSLPVYSCLGNHDIWGSSVKTNVPFKDDPQFGKKLGLDNLGMEKPYYSFDVGGWHFIMLDTIHPYTKGDRFTWMTKLGEEQMEWLKKDIESTPSDRNIVIGSHVPILNACYLYGRKPNKDLEYTIPNFGMLPESCELLPLFFKFPNVKLSFSGHLHRNDEVKLHHATYICDGSMCGLKWRRKGEIHIPGFSITTLHPDGTFDYKFEEIGWKPSKKSEG